MSNKSPTAAEIERLQRRRTRLLFTQGLFFLLWQTMFFASAERPADALRPVDHVKLGAYVIWAILLLLFLGTGGGYILPKAVRQVLNDESTVAHRAQATTYGFYAAMGAAIGCYVVSMFAPMSGRGAVHVILSIGIATALLNFGFLERRAQRDG